jgi:hypothetical protein
MTKSWRVVGTKRRAGTHTTVKHASAARKLGAETRDQAVPAGPKPPARKAGGAISMPGVVRRGGIRDVVAAPTGKRKTDLEGDLKKARARELRAESESATLKFG